MAREQAEKAAEDALTQALNDARLSQKEPHLDPEVPPSRHKPPGLAAPLPRGGQPPTPPTPPPGSPEAALLEGDLIIPGKHPRVERELPPQPSRPDGSFNPLRGRGLWGSGIRIKTRIKKQSAKAKHWLHKAFREHPVITWAAAGTVTAGAALGATYVVVCYGLPAIGHHLPGIAGLGALPLAGVLTTERRQRK